MAKGSCMCSAITYEYTGEPAVTALCHCVDCQKWTGAAYTSNVVVPASNFKITKGSPKTYDLVGDSGKINKHFFCDTCGSSLFTELEVMPDMMVIKSGGLDDGASNHPIGVEFYTKRRLDYSKPIENAKQEEAFGS